MNDENEVMTEATEDLTVTEPIVESSTGWGTLVGVAVAAAAAVFGGAKLTQKAYDKSCKKKGIDTPTREKFYQFWRKKAKGRMIKVNPNVQEGTIHEVTSDTEDDE